MNLHIHDTQKYLVYEDVLMWFCPTIREIQKTISEQCVSGYYDQNTRTHVPVSSVCERSLLRIADTNNWYHQQRSISVMGNQASSGGSHGSSHGHRTRRDSSSDDTSAVVHPPHVPAGINTLGQTRERRHSERSAGHERSTLDHRLRTLSGDNQW